MSWMAKPVSSAPGQAIHIPLGVWHRAVVSEGNEMTVLIFVMPTFDPADEWFD